MKKRKKSGDAEGAAGSNDGRSVVDALKQAHTCPITHALFVDPVVAADGNTYEREAIEKWLSSHSKSPVSNQELSCKTLFPSITARQSVTEIVNSEPDEVAAVWHVASGRAKYTQALPGGVAAANEHFENAVELGSEVAEMILKASEIQEKAKSQNVDIGWLFGATGRGNFTPIQEYGQLPPGTVVKVLADRDRLRHFCEDEPPPGFSEVVEWDPQMEDFAGKEAIVVGNSTVDGSYTLIMPIRDDENSEEIEDPPIFKFPYSALMTRA